MLKVKVYNSTLSGSGETDDMYNSIDMAIDKVKGQLKKHKGKLKRKNPEEIAETTEALTRPSTDVDEVLTSDAIMRLADIVRRVPVAPHVIRYALRLVRATRVREPDVPDFITEWLTWGAGPRAVQFLLLGGNARAALDGRTFVTTDDVRAVAHPVLRHRIITNFNAESEGITPDKIVDQLLATIPEAAGDEAVPAEVARAFKA